MEPIKNYKSFNDNKSIEELQYNITLGIRKLEHLKLELEFYSHILEKPIFKEHVMNLYERLTELNNEIKTLNTKRVKLLNNLYAHSNLIKNKIECEDMACDHFFIKEHDAIELQLFDFNTNITDFKFNFFQYMESVLIN